MSYRAADTMDFLRLKSKMVEGDHDAVFSDGRRLPVYIYARPNAETKYCVEINAVFYEAKLLPGFLRLEIWPHVKAEREAEAAEAEREALKAQEEKPSNYREFVAKNDKAALQALGEQYAYRRSQQGIVSSHALTEANRKHAAEVARGLKPNRRNQ